MIHRDAVNPRVDLGLLAEFFHMLIYFYENLLREIARGFFVPGEAIRQPENPLAIHSIQLIKTT
jgi:hypothetical protein